MPCLLKQRQLPLRVEPRAFWHIASWLTCGSQSDKNNKSGTASECTFPSSPWELGAFGRRFSHFPTTEVGNGLPCVQPCHEVLAGANSKVDRHYLPWRAFGAFPRLVGSGSRWCNCTEGPCEDRIGRLAYLDGIQDAAAHSGEPRGVGAIRDGHHRDPLWAPRPRPRSYHQGHSRSVCRNLHSLPLSPSTWYYMATTPVPSTSPGTRSGAAAYGFGPPRDPNLALTADAVMSGSGPPRAAAPTTAPGIGATGGPAGYESSEEWSIESWAPCSVSCAFDGGGKQATTRDWPSRRSVAMIHALYGEGHRISRESENNCGGQWASSSELGLFVLFSHWAHRLIHCFDF